MSSNSSLVYYLKKSDGALYGPSNLSVLKQWAREGRVAPDDLISKDQAFWYPAPTLTDLEMNWLVQLPDGTQYGPIHLHALQELVEEGSLCGDDVVINRITERMCTIREAMEAEPAAVVAETEQAPAPAEVASPDVTQTPGATPAEAPQTTAAPDHEAARKPSASVEAAAPVEPAAVAAAEPAPASWREVAARKDLLERELAKWKAMYEQEHEQFLRATREADERIQALRKSELAAHTRADQLERKLKESEENYRVLRESLAFDPERPHAQQIIALTEMHRELAHQYDSVTRLLQEKNAEISDLLEARARAESQTAELIRQMQATMEQERKEAAEARRRAVEMETEYLQLVQAYRELNEKYMQLRQELSAASTGAQRVSRK